MALLVPALLAFLGLVGLYFIVKGLSAAAARAYFAEKERHIKRVFKTINEEDKQ